MQMLRRGFDKRTGKSMMLLDAKRLLEEIVICLLMKRMGSWLLRNTSAVPKEDVCLANRQLGDVCRKDAEGRASKCVGV